MRRNEAGRTTGVTTPDESDREREEGGRTHVTLRSVFPTKEQRDEVVAHYGAIEGGRQTLEHLAAYAAELSEGTNDA